MFKFIKSHRLFFNSIVYGSFYTGAEILQQSYNKQFQENHVLSKKLFISEEAAEKPGSILRKIHKLNGILGLDRDCDQKPQDYNWAQIKRYAIYGCLMAGPALHFWYKWLDTIYKGTAAKTITKKLILDQFILTPALLISFFSSMSLMESETDIFKECKTKFLKTFQTSCMYWLPIQFANFVLVPPIFRVVYVSVAAFCWVNILLYLKRTPIESN